MPRKAFIADLEAAKKCDLPDHVYDLKTGDEDGTFNFLYLPGDQKSGVTVQAHVSDVGEYPSAHSYFVYTISENAPEYFNEALSETHLFDRLKVSQTIVKLANALDRAQKKNKGPRLIPIDKEGDILMVDSDESMSQYEAARELPEDEEEDEEDLSEADDFDQPPQSSSSGLKSLRTGSHARIPPSNLREFNNRIRTDLQAVKRAGFRVGCHGDLFNFGQGAIVMVSCRVSRLGIPEDVLKAWHLDRQEYLLLVIQYTDGYMPFEELIGSGAFLKKAQQGIKLCALASKKYKISVSEAIDAIARLQKRKEDTRASDAGNDAPGPSAFQEPDSLTRPLFIERPLNELLNTRLVDIIRCRSSFGMPWRGAEDFVNESQGRQVLKADEIADKYFANDGNHQVQHLPALVVGDHLGLGVEKPSFPLVAMQFTLRHLVRCTEFCLVCHCRVNKDFEALKPYVCSKALCLFQYISLGFGTGIEYEVLTQPHVVDLLISFCYNSASGRTLKELPKGLQLIVPHPSLGPQAHVSYLSNHRIASGGVINPASFGSSVQAPQAIGAKLDERNSELKFTTGQKMPAAGSWILLWDNEDRKQHRKVLEKWDLVVRLGPPILPPHSPREKDNKGQQSGRKVEQPHTPAMTPPHPIDTSIPGSEAADTSSFKSVSVALYDTNFDDLNHFDQQKCICTILDTIPHVDEMATYLKKIGAKAGALRDWSERMSPASVGLLRWIVASNRSCILQIDSLHGNEVNSEERVAGMKGYMQFRFAQGAPDKEERFIRSVNDAKNRLKLIYPTMFAWHGSPLQNWHSIIREGLNFDVTLHGRAYGNGVYHSLQVHTSLGYCGSSNQGIWPHSRLKISSAICLNELVNAPKEFVSSNPHLVVGNVDWIQTRYLFVRCQIPEDSIREVVPSQHLDQDTLQPQGTDGKPITIPITAISKSRRPSYKAIKTGTKKVKVIGDLAEDPILLSDDSDPEDLEILRMEDLVLAKPQKAPSLSFFSKAKNFIETPKTDFVPGKLDHSSLPILSQPSYATSQATKALQRELKMTLQTQAKQPQQELGWHFDPDHVENVYQWIIELHSFDPNLPLAKEMLAKKIQSVVLELRFGKDYPYSPPFVRVIRPRFLSFLQGGGGHVTAGGALCMELLTNTGWNPASSIESVLLQVRLAISSTDPQPARLEKGAPRDYSAGEAMAAYRRACATHGWTVPPDFNSM